MSRTVSFRCSQELDEFLEEEAERRMTTKSTVAQMIVAQYARDMSNDPDTVNTPVTPPEAREEASDGVNDGGAEPEVLDEDTEIRFSSKSAADGVREEFSQYLSESDDRRLKTVTLAEGTPGETVREIEERSTD